MHRPRKFTVIAFVFIVTLFILAVTSCGKTHAHSAAASSAAARASASAHAFATSPAIVRDENTELKKIAHCSATATNGELTIAATPSGQASVPGVPTPLTLQVTHASFLLAAHPFRETRAIYHCAVPRHTSHQAKACIRHLSLPTSKAAIATWFDSIAGCPGDIMIINEVGRALNQALYLLRTYGWIQGRYGNTSVGFCVSGAIMNSTGNTAVMSGAYAALIAATRKIAGQGMSCVRYNDAKETTFADIEALIQKAIAIAGGTR